MLASVGNKEFLFGLEAEYLLVSANTYAPLWHSDLSFAKLNGALETISLDGLPSLELLEVEPPHVKCMPYAVEGYSLVDHNFRAYDILPKGIEVRTPIAVSIESCLGYLQILHHRLSKVLLPLGYRPVALSHHPIATEFEGPQNKKRYDFWQWAMQVMTTYGPDVNIGLPDELSARLDVKDLHAKVNYYSPGLVALFVSSPFRAGELWKIRGGIGKSLRTYRRSVIAPALEIHPHERWRLEFKPFEMSSRLEDFYQYFLLWLVLLLDDRLKGRSSQQSRVYDLGEVAKYGLHAELAYSRAGEVLEKAPRVLSEWGFSSRYLSSLFSRWDRRFTPADEMILQYETTRSLEPILRSRSHLEPLVKSSGLSTETTVSATL